MEPSPVYRQRRTPAQEAFHRAIVSLDVAMQGKGVRLIWGSDRKETVIYAIGDDPGCLPPSHRGIPVRSISMRQYTGGMYR